MPNINIPEPSGIPRVVIIGGGFAGLSLARRLIKYPCQLVMIDKHNFHQFQPLFYQVAMSGLEPSSIAFPLRRAFHNKQNVFLRMAAVSAIDPDKSEIITSLGALKYDKLIIATGTDTNFYGNKNIAQLSIPMKSVSEALYLRNQILSDYELALSEPDYVKRQGLIDIVIVGGGPTGVEIAGSLAEMRRYVLPQEFKELDNDEVDIYLVEGEDRVLPTMSEKSSKDAERYLTDLGVIVKTGVMVDKYDGKYAYLSNKEVIRTNKLIWAAGVKGNLLQGLPEASVKMGGRIAVDRYNEVEGLENVFAIGDIAYMEEEKFPDGHPQVAQVAMQQGRLLAKNLKRLNAGKEKIAFSYSDKGSMATIGRSKAVVDLPYMHMRGFFAWFIWLVVHLFQLIGVKNKIFVFINWTWNYILYDQSLRLIIRPYLRRQVPVTDADNSKEPNRVDNLEFDTRD